jgi:hypothetical protein
MHLDLVNSRDDLGFLEQPVEEFNRKVGNPLI